jgi:biotin-(acetyl-CoA carboxylase) ligase
MHFIELKEINSTNFYSSELIKNKIINQETIVFAYKQTDGKGLGNNKWLSEPFKNIFDVNNYISRNTSYRFF